MLSHLQKKIHSKIFFISIQDLIRAQQRSSWSMVEDIPTPRKIDPSMKVLSDMPGFMAQPVVFKLLAIVKAL